MKNFLWGKFQGWYADEIMKQLDNVDNLEEVELEPINLGLLLLKELDTKWLIETTEYISENPHFISKGFISTGILGALDGKEFEHNTVDENKFEDSNDEAFDDIELDDEEVLQMVDAMSDGDDD